MTSENPFPVSRVLELACSEAAPDILFTGAGPAPSFALLALKQTNFKIFTEVVTHTYKFRKNFLIIRLKLINLEKLRLNPLPPKICIRKFV